MQRIEALDPAVAQRIRELNERFHTLGEEWTLYSYRGRKGINLTPWLLEEIGEVMAWLNVDYAQFLQLYNQWDSYVAGFDGYETPRDFYLSWTGDMGRSNLCVNTVNQILPYYPLYVYLQDNWAGKPVAWADYGCGSGAFSFVAARFLSFSKAGLYDVPNAAKAYVQHRIARMGQGVWTWRNVLHELEEDERYDLMVCLDVLEHLEDSSAAMQNLHRLLQPGGTLLLRAPWGNHPEHIPEAAVDFYTTGGAELLDTEFELVNHFGHMHVNGVYRKRNTRHG